MRNAWVVVLLVAACAKSSQVPCDDGRTCPAGTVCEDGRQLCIAPAQSVVCGQMQIEDGFPCTADGKPGICDRGLCLPGCGDGLTRDDEECDDANFASNDGCSSLCVVEVPSWREIPDGWSPISRHAATTDTTRDRVVLAGGVTTDGLRTVHTHRFSYASEPYFGWTLPAQSALTAREAPAMAYDPSRDIIVLFGGIKGTTLLADTWVYTAAAGWSQITPPASPDARYYATMAFDPVAQKVVLFGGTKGPDAFQDTWAFDGTTWTKVTTNAPPTRRYLHAMTTDRNRNRIVMYGGIQPFNGPYAQDTWEYADGTWTLISSTSPPGLRFGAAMAYTTTDTSGRTILYGGMLSTNQTASDTWQYDGTWTRIVTAVSPPGRHFATLSMAGDGLVLVGGQADALSPPMPDAWRFQNGSWFNITPSFAPTARSASPLVYDDGNAELHMVGGYSGVTIDDAWTFTGTFWYTTTHLPNRPVRFAHAMGYDYTRKQLVVFGGASAGELATDTTYGYASSGNSGTWSLLDPPAKPPARAYGSFAFDGTTLVLFGGDPNGPNGTFPIGDTWEFDGTTWTRAADGPAPSKAAASAYDPLHGRMVLLDRMGATWSHANHAWAPVTTEGPPAREHAAMTYDYMRKRILLIGGISSETREPLSDVWELDGNTWTQVYVPGPGPLPRTEHGLASHRAARTTLLIGGSGSTGDVWELKYRSTTPDEICDDANEDDDGDLHDDRNDPDCQERGQQ